MKEAAAITVLAMFAMWGGWTEPTFETTDRVLSIVISTACVAVCWAIAWHKRASRRADRSVE